MSSVPVTKDKVDLLINLKDINEERKIKFNF